MVSSFDEANRFEDFESFDRNWAGPEELRPRVYRSQLEKDIWHSIAVHNEYRLGDLQASDVVIDIGANIGAFSYLASLKGSKEVYAFEIEKVNVDAMVENLSGKDVAIHHAAIVRGDDLRAPVYHYTGAWNSFGSVGPIVDSLSLDDILKPHEQVRFLKMDCEGCEWPILYTSKLLSRVQEIAGEYHLINPEGHEYQGAQELRDLPYQISTDGLRLFLENQGFDVEIVEANPTIGNFFAKKKVEIKPLPRNTLFANDESTVFNTLDTFNELGKEIIWLNAQPTDALTIPQLAAIRRSQLLWKKLSQVVK